MTPTRLRTRHYAPLHHRTTTSCCWVGTDGFLTDTALRQNTEGAHNTRLSFGTKRPGFKPRYAECFPGVSGRWSTSRRVSQHRLSGLGEVWCCLGMCHTRRGVWNGRTVVGGALVGG